MLNATEKRQCLEYIDDVIKALEILIKDLRKISSFPIDMRKYKRRLVSSDIVCDCLYFKNVVEPPKSFIEIQKQINKACDIYLDFYGQLPERVDDYDITWVKHFSSKLIWANRVVVGACKTLSKMQKEQKFWRVYDLLNA